jgi:hypothetical protein
VRLLRLISSLVLVSAAWPASRAADPPVAESTAAAPTWQILGASKVTLIGSEMAVSAQVLPVGPAAPPPNWKLLSNMSLPTVNFAFGEFAQLAQSGEASGTFVASTGLMTLELPVKLTDSGAESTTFTVHMTTEKTNGTYPDGSPACVDKQDPSVCQGTRRNPATGAVRLVGIGKIPAGAGTIVDSELLFIELDSVMTGQDGDGDGVEDFVDNCAAIPNANQADVDKDGLGDVCDPCTDKDADGFGSPGAAACPRGATVDCNDTNATVYPGAGEICDTLDNDCNTSIDEATCEDFDADGDTSVDGAELAWLSRAFGLCSATTQWWAPVDYDGDGCVDGQDLAVLSSVWGCTSGPICQ